MLALPRTFWEGEEVRFALALLTFGPDAPLYPLYLALGRLVNVFVRDPFLSLVALSVIASIAGAVVLSAAAGRLLGNGWLGAAASIILYCSPAMLVFSPLPNAEAVTVALVAATLLFADHAVLSAVFAAAAIAARPQLAPAMVLLAIMLPGRRNWLAFGAVLLICFAPLVGSAVDVQLSFATDNLLRFTAHPWGAKYLAVPLLALAAFGLFRRRLPYLAAFAATHIAVCVLFAPRFEGVQPVIAALLPIAIYAAAALPARISVVVALIYAVASFAYVSPLLTVRRTSGAAAVSAAEAARQAPRSTVLVDPTFEPFADYYDLNAQPVKAFGDYARSKQDLLLMIQGRSESPNAQIFEWPDSDAYGKLTSEQYRVVSLVPIPPSRRYIPRLGVYTFESAPERGEWQWLAREAAVDLPVRSAVIVRLGLPPDAPIETNEVRINSTTVIVRRGERTTVEVPESDRLVVSSARSYADGDGRDLAVQLISIQSGVRRP